MLTDTERERLQNHADRPPSTDSRVSGNVQSDPSTSYFISEKGTGYEMKYTFLGARFKDDTYTVIKYLYFFLEDSECQNISSYLSALSDKSSGGKPSARRWGIPRV